MTKNKIRTDSEIKEDIETELSWDPTVEETEVDVIVKDGAVTLTGFVTSLSQKISLREAAKRISGVRAIADNMEVKIPEKDAGSDKDIAEHISRLFASNTQISKEDIKVEVRDGFVTLSGEVTWNYQRKTAQKQVEFIPGIKFVRNNIILRKTVETSDIKNNILKALHRHAQIEADHIVVMAKDDIVTLSGNVDTYLEKELIKKAVWASPGVHKVVDNMVIGYL